MLPAVDRRSQNGGLIRGKLESGWQMRGVHHVGGEPALPSRGGEMFGNVPGLPLTRGVEHQSRLRAPSVSWKSAAGVPEGGTTFRLEYMMLLKPALLWFGEGCRLTNRAKPSRAPLLCD
jgi:hypothetical protein